MSVMATSGYAGATIPLIAQAAGITPGLVHYHFDSKQSILIELVKHLMTLVNERFTRACKSHDAASRLDAYIDAHLSRGKGANPQAVACWINIGAEAVNQPEVRLIYQQATQQQLGVLEDICYQVLRRAGRNTAKKREIALGIIAAIEGSYRLLISAHELIPRGFAAMTVKDMAHGLIAAQSAARGKRSK